MTVFLVLSMFVVILLVDTLLHRTPVQVAAPKTQPQTQPRLLPSLVGGFKVMDNLRYHPGHTWAVSESPELARVGIDDFAAKIVGKIEKVLLPNRGQWIRQGQKIVAIQHDGVAVEMISPVEGSVVDINEAVANDPELARRDPYGDGWLFTVNSPDMKTNFRNLLGGTIARRWMEEAAARLRQMVPAPVGVYAQDGGAAIDDVAAHLPKDEWEKVTKEFFLS